MSKEPRDGHGSGDLPDSVMPQVTAGPPQTPQSQGTNAPNASTSKIVGNQAKKQEETTRQGTQKMKFVPTLPLRRKKPDMEVKQKEAAVPSKPTERGRGRGRGLGRGRGGPPPPRPEMQMTASGPFAMGPALAGSSRRRVPRSNFTPVMPMGPGSASLGDGLSRSGAPVLSREREKAKKGLVKHDDNDDEEVYSDPDEGVQIVDMDAIKTMDWMAPESLRRDRDDGKTSKSKKTKSMKQDVKGKSKAKDVETVAEEEVEKNLANALNLSESEEEEEMEDLIEDFTAENTDIDEEDSMTRQEKLYFFQFPHPFPTFTLPVGTEATENDSMPVDEQKSEQGGQVDVPGKGKKVSFAPDVKPPAQNGAQGEREVASTKGAAVTKPGEEQKLDGVIGQLEVHRSGVIKMRFGNGILLDVTAATQPSFLQHAVLLDDVGKKLHVLGEVNRRFVVSPDVDKLLEEMDKAEAAAKVKTESAEV